MWLEQTGVWTFMDSVWKTFRATKLGTSAAWALGVTALTTVLGHGVAQAVTASCPSDPITSAGGSTTATATPISPVCDGTQITGAQGFPTYWEFTWQDASGNSTIDANMTNTGDGGSFSGNLELLDSTGTNVLQSASFFMPGSIGSSTDPAITNNMTNGTSYILGITEDVPDPSFTITFSATPTPEPASLGLFGGALAALAAFRKRRKLSR
jgi:hypothetical protein